MIIRKKACFKAQTFKLPAEIRPTGSVGQKIHTCGEVSHICWPEGHLFSYNNLQVWYRFFLQKKEVKGLNYTLAFPRH